MFRLRKGVTSRPLEPFQSGAIFNKMRSEYGNNVPELLEKGMIFHQNTEFKAEMETYLRIPPYV